MKHDVVFRIGGEGGEGVISCGEILTLACARMGLEIYTFRSYPAEIKGGPAMFQVRTSKEFLLSQGSEIDVLVCFNQEAYDRHAKDLRKDGQGVIVYDSSSTKPQNGIHAILYEIPVSEMAKLELRNYLTKNIIFLGILAKLFSIDFLILETIIRQKFGKKGEAILNLNFQALRAGYQYVEKNITKKDDYLIEAQKSENRLVLSGNQAVALGAIQAGMRFYAGYPITPATDIMEFLARELPRFDGTVVQAEDEIAAIGMVLGAAFSGVKAMTASSGPGIDLMTEFLGLASMAEVPCVIIDCQRAGPSTGMPTKTEQSDLRHAISAGHGDAPRIVMALTSVEDAFYGMIRAFNYAVRCQVPVIVLSDQYLAQRTATVRKPEVTKVAVEEAKKPTSSELEHYKRFQMTDSGVSPMTVPGTKGGAFSATGIEHTEDCELSYEPDNHRRMSEKRWRKLNQILQGPDLFRRHGPLEADIGIVGWGSSEGVIREAIAMANAKGYRVAAFHPKVLHPMPNELGDFIKSVKAVIVPELNFTGQFAKEIRARYLTDVIQLNKVAGLPFTPNEILKKIEEVAETCLKQTHHKV
ncbi:MAG: 2-oxoacid:acceptor oxidoreductase subunit alpha [Candidatus Omnitrophica bacterium]|nr:2-oxoacid:acceptor oxidoreductase subunit alpha [Candidatus Omnitrophota bacterium]